METLIVKKFIVPALIASMACASAPVNTANKEYSKVGMSYVVRKGYVYPEDLGELKRSVPQIIPCGIMYDNKILVDTTCYTEIRGPKDRDADIELWVSSVNRTIVYAKVYDFSERKATIHELLNKKSFVVITYEGKSTLFWDFDLP